MSEFGVIVMKLFFFLYCIQVMKAAELLKKVNIS